MTAHRSLDKDALRSLLSGLRDTSWSWREADVPALAAGLGWHLGEVVTGTGAVADPGHGLGRKAVRFAFDDGQVRRITMRITSIIDEDDQTDQAFLREVCQQAAALGAEVLGEPTTGPAGGGQVRWRGEQATLVLQVPAVAVTLVWSTNAFQDHWDALSQE
ncbi:DUF6301 family protein [Couchioplanes caeruleus]|uniref:Uncharacterized protein n=2 Tax=Couchioplanes caeruleus TaxID=56438 RepID=A0A1K0FSI4_9ACTN|nr:DUF6301 family protein [Couchioplanes caeruleus]OJF15815.1 hypothetical protein BG844_02600 [Couchioplanes caeruleus subsp. caeruleus]ROP33015.1 hypothetical protein EDD30_5980 [Couchioplanes caeruleus]